MENKNREELLETAANWWATKINGRIKFDNGDDSIEGQLLSTLAALKAKSQKENEQHDTIYVFKELLKDAIEEDLNNYGISHLKVDYQPEGHLSEIGQKCGFDEFSSFPWKHRMEVTEDSIRVVEGYGMPSKVIYSNEFDFNKKIKSND